uniref:TPR_REGION domain-containing protein n=1 Tax=Steinernema glaseri TaxID=37863 RepID=A0A1I7ZUI7_9BILA
MLNDIFGELGLGDDILETQEKPDRTVSQQAYVAADQSDGWFNAVSDENDWEISLVRASSLYSEGRYSEAYSFFDKALQGKKHKTSHQIGLLESKIRSAVRGKCVSESQLKQDLELLQSCISTHGEQIQYWELLNEFYASFSPVNFLEHCRVVILLCVSSDYSKFWRMFQHLRCDNLCNFYVFSACRAVYLLKNEAEMCSGHLKKRCLQMAEEISKEVNEKFPEKVEEASESARGHTHNRRDYPSDDLPAHACKSDVAFKNDMEQKKMVAEFVRKFSYFFADWPPSLVTELEAL